MKRDERSSAGDYSFLNAMSTKQLQDILRQDIELNENESDLDLVLHVMEVLEEREKEAGASNAPNDAGAALERLHKAVSQREQMFAGLETEQPESSQTVLHRTTRFWPRIAGIAAAIALLIGVGTTAAGAMGYDLWGGVARWTKETFSFGEKTAAFSPNETYDELKDILYDNGITIPVLPNWLPEQYTFEDIRVYENSDSSRITAIATANENTMVFQIISFENNYSISQVYEVDGNSVQQYETRGITHYIMTNDNSIQIIWSKDKYQVMMEWSDLRIDAIKILDSIYVG